MKLKIHFTPKDIHELAKFGIVGITVTGILYCIYWILLNWLNPTISYSIGYLFAFIVNYVLTTSYTFKVKKTFKNISGFIISNILNYFFSIIFLNLFLYTGISKESVPIFVVMISMCLNFLMVRFVMKKI